ncbi:MAG: hypothetical protein KDD25_01475 [Bdellovibrionales bacterium]|nr:hypothetical protein [Bdellovibrionales bacterium]
MAVWFVGTTDWELNKDLRNQVLRIPEVIIRLRQSQDLVSHFSESEEDYFSLIQSDSDFQSLGFATLTVIRNAIDVGIFEASIRKNELKPSAIVGNPFLPFTALALSGSVEFERSVELSYLWGAISHSLGAVSVFQVSGLGENPRGELRVNLMKLIEKYSADLVHTTKDGDLIVNVMNDRDSEFTVESKELGLVVKKISKFAHPKSVTVARELIRLKEHFQVHTLKEARIPIWETVKQRTISKPSTLQRWMWNEVLSVTSYESIEKDLIRANFGTVYPQLSIFAPNKMGSFESLGGLTASEPILAH